MSSTVKSRTQKNELRPEIQLVQCNEKPTAHIFCVAGSNCQEGKVNIAEVT